MILSAIAIISIILLIALYYYNHYGKLVGNKWVNIAYLLTIIAALSIGFSMAAENFTPKGNSTMTHDVVKSVSKIHQDVYGKEVIGVTGKSGKNYAVPVDGQSVKAFDVGNYMSITKTVESQHQRIFYGSRIQPKYDYLFSSPNK